MHTRPLVLATLAVDFQAAFELALPGVEDVLVQECHATTTSRVLPVLLVACDLGCGILCAAGCQACCLRLGRGPCCT